jgi:hypothetical protein
MKLLREISQNLDASDLSTREDIDNWLFRVCLSANYTIHDDLSVSLDGSLALGNLSITKLPVKFRQVTGQLTLPSTLTTLEGCPDTVGLLSASCTRLTSLKGISTHADSISLIDCANLTSLEGLPRELNYLNISGCTSLTSLEGCPEWIYSIMFAYRCVGLKNLKGGPSRIGGHTAKSVSNCALVLEDCTGLTSLDGHPTYFGKDSSLCLSRCKSLPRGVLDFLHIIGLKRVEISNGGVQKILNKFLPLPASNARTLACQSELIDEGFEEYATWWDES